MHVPFPQDEVLVAADLDLVAGIGGEEHLVAFLDESGFLLIPALRRNVPYDPVRDFTPLALVAM